MVVVKAAKVISKKLLWFPLRNLGAAPPLIAEATNKATVLKGPGWWRGGTPWQVVKTHMDERLYPDVPGS